jgi:hypothetical protein
LFASFSVKGPPYRSAAKISFVLICIFR